MADMGELGCVEFVVRDRKAYVTLNRPGAMNAINSAMRAGLREAFTQVTQDDEILVAILSGAGGRAFSAGADLKEMAGRESGPTRPSGPRSYPEAPRPGRLEGLDELDACAKPVIAAIDGYCLAAGFELALCCDIRVATAQSTFGLPEPRWSLLAGPGLINLSRMIPLGEALRMQLTGSPMTAERAYQVGLVQELAASRDQLMATADALAEEILQCAPLAVQYIKRIVRDGRGMPVEHAWKFSEMFWASIAQTEDAAEGPQSFAQKRKPEWKGR
jgi:enoyl-CoA hydratase/carnithine racemase